MINPELLGIQPMIQPKVDNAAFGRGMSDIADFREKRRQALAQETETNRHNVAYEDYLTGKNDISRQKIEADWKKLDKKDQDRLWAQYDKALASRDPVQIQAATDELARYGISAEGDSGGTTPEIKSALGGEGGPKPSSDAPTSEIPHAVAETPPAPAPSPLHPMFPGASGPAAGMAMPTGAPVAGARGALASALGMPPPAAVPGAEPFTPHVGEGPLPQSNASIIADVLGQKKPALTIPDQTITAEAPKPAAAEPTPQAPRKKVFRDRDGNVVRTVDESAATGGDQTYIMRTLQPLIDSASSPEEKAEALKSARLAASAVEGMPPSKALDEGLKIFQTEMGKYKKVGRPGSGGGGPAPEGQKQIDKDDEFDLKVAKDKETRYKDARSAFDATDRVIHALQEGQRTGFKDTLALDQTIKSAVGGRASVQQLKMIFHAAGKGEEFGNLLGQYFDGGKFTPEFARQMLDAAVEAKAAAKEVIDREVSGAEALLRHHYRNRPDKVREGHVKATKEYMVGGSSAPAEGGDDKDAANQRIDEWLKKGGK